MARVIGNAADFYRLRVMRVDESDPLEFEWREDILYRRPPEEDVDEYELWRVEAVHVDDEEDVTELGTFESAPAAHAWMTETLEDLAEMTKSEFEDTYFAADAAD